MAPRKRKSTTSDVSASVTAVVTENKRLTARVAELEGDLAAIAAALNVKPKAAVAKTRRKVTDPAVLERKREALTKARAARAANRAAVVEPEPAAKPQRVRKPKVVTVVGPAPVPTIEPAVAEG